MYCIVLMNLIMLMILLLFFMYIRFFLEWFLLYIILVIGGDWFIMMGELEILMVFRFIVNRIKYFIRMVKLLFNYKWLDKIRKYCYSIIMYFKYV